MTKVIFTFAMAMAFTGFAQANTRSTASTASNQPSDSSAVCSARTGGSMYKSQILPAGSQAKTQTPAQGESVR